MTPALAIKQEVLELDVATSNFSTKADFGASVSNNVNSVPTDIVLEREANLNLTATVLYTDEDSRSDMSAPASIGIQNILNRMQEVSLEAAQANDEHTDRTSLSTEMEAMFIEAQLLSQLVYRLNNNC